MSVMMTEVQFFQLNCFLIEIIMIGLLSWCWRKVGESLRAPPSVYIRRDSITIPVLMGLLSLYLMYQTACYAGWI